MAADVVGYLRDFEWEVYQEVQLSSYSPVCDIVAMRGSILWAIEVKTNVGLTVIGQAVGWLRYSNLVSIATPYLSKSRIDLGLMRMLLPKLGLGWLRVGRGYNDTTVNEYIRPQLRRARDPRFGAVLTERHKDFAPAGNSHGLRLTPFSLMCAEVRRAVQAKPGISLRELVASNRFHYASDTSARGAIAKWISVGKVKGVVARMDSRLLCLYPDKSEGGGS